MSPLLHCCAAIGVHHILRSRCLATRSAEHSGDNRSTQSTYPAPFSRVLVSQQLTKCIPHRSRLIIWLHSAPSSSSTPGQSATARLRSGSRRSRRFYGISVYQRLEADFGRRRKALRMFAVSLIQETSRV